MTHELHRFVSILHCISPIELQAIVSVLAVFAIGWIAASTSGSRRRSPMWLKAKKGKTSPTH